MRLEAEAVAERVGPAGAFPDPMFRVELQDIENDGRGLPTLLPNRVGATKQPTYRFVVTESRNARNGRSLDTIGHYNPRTDPIEIKVRGYSLSLRRQEAESVIVEL